LYHFESLDFPAYPLDEIEIVFDSFQHQKAGEGVHHKVRYQRSSGFVAGRDGFNPATNHYNDL
jgi:hypothetical protein